MEKTRTTTDHEQIKLWVEERGGHPARVKGTAVEGSSGVLLIEYPGYSNTQTLEAISWDEFFKGFEENELAFLYQDERKAGSQTRFSKLVNRDAPLAMEKPRSLPAEEYIFSREITHVDRTSANVGPEVTDVSNTGLSSGWFSRGLK